MSGVPDVKGAFDAAAPGYDALRRQLIPCFDDFYGAAVDGLGFRRGAAPRILDLGAGTGLLSELVLRRWPRARLALVDLSTDMLDRARARFEGRAARVEIRTADYLRDPLGGPFDAVISALSIHHLPDAGKRTVFRRAFAALRPGGVFVDADNVLAPTAGLAARDRRSWIARIRESGIGEADLAAALLRTRLDRLSPLADQLTWLRRAGFVDVDCSYKWLHFAVFGGRRS
ncbi:MAG: class I SAM-dependent methyltransferase [Deltaproteobacteria bacterium]